MTFQLLFDFLHQEAVYFPITLQLNHCRQLFNSVPTGTDVFGDQKSVHENSEIRA